MLGTSLQSIGGLQGLGSLMGGLGSLYSGYMQQKMAKDMFSMQKQSYNYQKDEEEKRLKGLGSLGGYYGNTSTVGGY
jgi:hypothetical protein